MVLKVNLYYNQVTLPRRGILFNPELNILIIECLIISFCAKRFPNIIIIISVINIILRLSLVIVKVFKVIY